jgi:hypothetical protein
MRSIAAPISVSCSAAARSPRRPQPLHPQAQEQAIGRPAEVEQPGRVRRVDELAVVGVGGRRSTGLSATARPG